MHKSKFKASSGPTKESLDGGGAESSTKNNKLDENDEDTIKQQRLLTECNICLDIARDAVISMCGHLYCWPCLHRWLYITNNSVQSNKTCPVCKSAISKEKVIPIYGRDQGDRKDPRDSLPPRPAGHWTEAPNQNQFSYGNIWAMGGQGAQMFGIGDGGFHMTFGIRSFPQYIYEFINEYRNFEGNDEANCVIADIFAFCGFLCIILTLYFC